MPRRYKRSYRTKRRGKSTKAVAYQALSLAKKQARQVELKNVETAISTAISSTGYVTSLAAVSQGDGNNDRTGDKINPTRLHVRGKLNLNASATSSLVRLIVYSYKSGTSTAVTDILPASPTVEDFKSDAKRYASKILYDKVLRINDVSMPEKYFQFSCKLPSYIAYNGGTTTPTVNGVYMLLLSDESTNTPTPSINCRLHFKDQ